MKYKRIKWTMLLMAVLTAILFCSCGSVKKGGIINQQKNISAQKNDTENSQANTEALKSSNSESKITQNSSSSVSETESNPSAAVKLKSNNESIPVLMYHSIMYEKGNELRVPKEKFYEQMKYLKENGYTTLSLNELYDFLINNKPVPEKSIAITFDDGYVDNYTNAYPVLKEFGFKATIFVITCTVDKDSSYLTSSQLKELESNGIQIEGHTVNHDELSKLPYDKQLKTLKDSKKFIDDLLGKEVKYTAYPFGKYNGETIKAAKEAGYTMAFTTIGGWADKSDGIMTLNRVYVSSLASMEDFKYRITHPEYSKK